MAAHMNRIISYGIEDALPPHTWVCADNVPAAEKNHAEGYVYCSACGTGRTSENDGGKCLPEPARTSE